MTITSLLDKLETADETDSETNDEEEEESELSEGEREEMEETMKQMDKELSETTVGQSFQNISGEDSLQPVDVDFNLVHNLLDCYKEQTGEATPTSNILQTLGLSFSNKLHKQK